jgi:high-affinity iron transporter
VFDAFAVMLRESAELILILASLVACLRSARAGHLLRWTAAGAMAGCTLGAGLSLWLIASDIDARWTAGLTFVLAVGVLLMVSTMLVTATSIRSRTQALVEVWLERPSAPLVILGFATVVAFRETLEVGLFLRSQWLRAEGLDVLAGAALGVLGVVCLVIASRKISTRIGLLAAFRVSALVLSLLSIQMMLGALAEFAHESVAAGADAQLLAWARPALPEGRWYGWMCAALMSVPVVCVLRSWWRETCA